MKDEKPFCPLIGADGNIFNLVYIATNELKENDKHEEAKEMWNRVQGSEDYHVALGIIFEYVEPCDETTWQKQKDNVEESNMMLR